MPSPDPSELQSASPRCRHRRRLAATSDLDDRAHRGRGVEDAGRLLVLSAGLCRDLAPAPPDARMIPLRISHFHVTGVGLFENWDTQHLPKENTTSPHLTVRRVVTTRFITYVAPHPHERWMPPPILDFARNARAWRHVR